MYRAWKVLSSGSLYGFLLTEENFSLGDIGHFTVNGLRTFFATCVKAGTLNVSSDLDVLEESDLFFPVERTIMLPSHKEHVFYAEQTVDAEGMLLVRVVVVHPRGGGKSFLQESIKLGGAGGIVENMPEIHAFRDKQTERLRKELMSLVNRSRRAR